MFGWMKDNLQSLILILVGIDNSFWLNKMAIIDEMYTGVNVIEQSSTVRKNLTFLRC